MKTTFFLIVKPNGTVKVTKTNPALNWDEIAIQHTIELPDMLFKKPRLQAEIIIPAESVQPQVISAQMQDNILNAIKNVSGLEVKITFPETDANDIL